MNSVKLTIIVAAIALFIAACGQTANTPTTNSNNQVIANKPATPAPVQTVDEAKVGSDLYTVNCMTCHKDSGKGGPVTVEGKKLEPDDLTAEKFKKMTDEKLIGYVRDGIEDEGMPSFKDKLTEAQMASVIKHVRTLQSK